MRARLARRTVNSMPVPESVDITVYLDVTVIFNFISGFVSSRVRSCAVLMSNSSRSSPAGHSSSAGWNVFDGMFSVMLAFLEEIMN